MCMVYTSVIVITDGVSNINPDQTLVEAKRLRDQGIVMITQFNNNLFDKSYKIQILHCIPRRTFISCQ